MLIGHRTRRMPVYVGVTERTVAEIEGNINKHTRSHAMHHMMHSQP